MDSLQVMAFMKSSPPMLVTELGMLTEVRLEQLAKASSPMVVTPTGIVVFMQPLISVFDAVSIIALLFSRESYTALPSSTIIEVRPLQ